MLGGAKLDQPIKQIIVIALERVQHAQATRTKIIDVAFWRGAHFVVLRLAHAVQSVHPIIPAQIARPGG